MFHSGYRCLAVGTHGHPQQMAGMGQWGMERLCVTLERGRRGPGPEYFRRQGGAITSTASSPGQDKKEAQPQADRGVAEEVYGVSWG